MKRQSMQWKTAESPRPKKARLSKSKIKVMLIAFFDQKGLVHHEFVPESEAVNRYFYQQVLVHLHDVFDAPGGYCGVISHGSSTMTMHLSCTQRGQCEAALDHSPYSPDLALCDFRLFPRLKIVIKGAHFSSSEEIRASVTKKLKSLKQEEFAKCFRGWQDKMQKSITSDGEYFEGDNL